MRGTSVHIKNIRIKQLCNRKVPDFAMALLARKASGAFQKRAQVTGYLRLRRHSLTGLILGKNILLSQESLRIACLSSQ